MGATGIDGRGLGSGQLRMTPVKRQTKLNANDNAFVEDLRLAA